METEITEKRLKTPENFDFPFKPYPIQADFMKNLYTLLEERKLGIFESPTGTGKSLSILCGALKWLVDHEERQREEIEQSIEVLSQEKRNCSTADWFNSQSKEIEVNVKINKIKIVQEKIKKFDEKIKKIRSKKTEVKPKWTEKEAKSNDENESQPESLDEDEFLLEESSNLSSDEDEGDQEDKFEATKIFICSRTHSQLAQLVHEVEKTVFNDKVRVVTLASRQNYCVNPEVNKLNNIALINERCLDLQKKSSKSTRKDPDGNSVKKKREKSTCKCPYMQQTQIEQLKNSALNTIQDVEDLIKKGKKLNACPYYAARSAVDEAQIIVLPYNLILHKSTREASGIKLKNNIVVIDEAHNLLEALAEMYSAQISGYQLIYAQSQLTEYKNKYLTRFNAQNLLCINQILFIIKKFIRILGGKKDCTVRDVNKEPFTKMYKFEDFITETDIDNLNIYDLLNFASKSKLCHKLLGFTQKFQPSVNISEKKVAEKGISAFLKEISIDKNQQIENEVKEKEIQNQVSVPRNPILAVVAFLECFTNRCEDGRIVCSKQSLLGKSSLKFVLLNPSSHFKSIVSEARAVLVAGGTMQPMSEFRDRLFISSGAKENRIFEFSCDHIVPSENILPIIVSNGPMGNPLDFSYNFRNQQDTLNELGSVLQNVCSIVPSGVVCFFPSYDYEKLVYTHLEKMGTLKQISNKKMIFREPKLSSDVDKTLSLYAKAIKHCSGGKTGAILFSVVGGKLSEGLNFSDDLGRCVIVVGMPYPNIKSPELQEKMIYLDKTEGTGSGNVYYENLCMKAVNQCIGRAVRHRNDYACVLLLDKRYARSKTKEALPKWIQRSLVCYEKFGQAFGNITKFFNLKKSTSS